MTDHTMLFIVLFIICAMIGSILAGNKRQFSKKSALFFGLSIILTAIAVYSRVTFNNWYENECSKLSGVMVNNVCYEDELPAVLIDR